MYEGGTSPSGSHYSAESDWSNSPSSFTSSHHLPHDYLVEPTAQFSHTPLPHQHATYSQHYPAYHGQHRVGLEHVCYEEHPSNSGESYYAAPPGYPVDSLLSPEIFDNVTARVATPSEVKYPATSSHEPLSASIPATNQSPGISTFSVSRIPNDGGRSLFPDAGPYLRQQLGFATHEPIDLCSLPDPPPGEKPSIPLPLLIKLAIYGSANKQLTLQEIYAELENRFQWFRDHKHEKAWKNSIRHNLSLNKVFRRVPRLITEPGKGSYWQLDVSGGEGYKRTRKRRPKNRIIASEEEDEEASEMGEDCSSLLDPIQGVGPSRSSATPIEDTQIDPELRNQGHVVGEGRTRSTTRRTGGGSPYPSQSPRYQQGLLPASVGQDASMPGQPSVRFGQPSIDQSSFPTYPQTRPMPASASSLLFAAMSSPPVIIPPASSTGTPLRLQYMAPCDQSVLTSHPSQTGIKYVVEPGNISAVQHMRTFPESHGQLQSQPPSESSSSGSCAISGSQTDNQ